MSEQTESIIKTDHAPADVKRDILFPSIRLHRSVEESMDKYLLTVSYRDKKTGTETSQTGPVMEHTSSMGRAGFFREELLIGDRLCNIVLVKGTGVPLEFRRESVSQVELGIRAPYSVHSRNEGAVLMTNNEIPGLAVRDDQTLDAQYSLLLDSYGIKSRIPLGGYYLESLETESGQESVVDLKNQGLLKKDEVPYISLWAMETPYRVFDLVEIIDKGSDKEIRNFLIDAAQYTTGDNNVYIEFSQNFNDLLSSDASTPELLELWTDFILSNCTETYSKLHSKWLGLVSGHDHNISLHGEVCDSSQIVTATSIESAKNIDKTNKESFLDRFKNIWDVYSSKNPDLDSKHTDRFKQKVNTFLN